MLTTSVLIVDEDDKRRRALAQGFAGRGERCLDVADGFAAMAALGRADFGVVVAAEGRRRLSLRGLCQLARKRHPQILIFVLPRPGTTGDEIRAALELPVELLVPDERYERLVTTILTRVETDAVLVEDTGIEVSLEPTQPVIFNPFDDPLSPEEPALDSFNVSPRVAVPQLAVNEPPPPRLPQRRPSQRMQGASFDLPDADADPPEPTRVDASRPTSSTQSAPPTEAIVVVDGHFEDVSGGAGAALLMSLFAQELTGRLAVDDGEARGTLYLHRGEPVWADDPAGDAGVYRKLVQKSFLKPEQAIDPVPEGMLLGALMQAGLLGGEQMHAFMREIVRDRVLAVATQAHGAYRFAEDRSFLDTAPLLKVNPFGLILDSRRRSLPPPALMALHGEIESLYPIPGPGLGVAGEKISPFLRGARAVDVIDGQRTVAEVLQAAGLDPFMGTLVFVVLRDAKLIALEHEPREQQLDLSDAGFDEASIEFAADDAASGPSSTEEARAHEDIYALYMRLKPLTQPRQVLGVGVDAVDAEIAAAYEARMQELDPRRVPEGSAQHILAMRIDELRRKVQNAYQTLRLQRGNGDDDKPGNPF